MPSALLNREPFDELRVNYASRTPGGRLPA
jgi:hypothetical protein